MIGIVLVFGAFAIIASLLFRRTPSWSSRRAELRIISWKGDNAAIVFAVVESAVLIMNSSRDIVSFHLIFAGDAVFIAVAGIVLVTAVALTSWGVGLLTMLGVVFAVINEVHENGENGFMLLAIVLPLLWLIALIRGVFGGNRARA